MGKMYHKINGSEWCYNAILFLVVLNSEYNFMR